MRPGSLTTSAPGGMIDRGAAAEGERRLAEDGTMLPSPALSAMPRRADGERIEAELIAQDDPGRGASERDVDDLAQCCIAGYYLRRWY